MDSQYQEGEDVVTCKVSPCGSRFAAVGHMPPRCADQRGKLTSSSPVRPQTWNVFIAVRVATFNWIVR